MNLEVLSYFFVTFTGKMLEQKNGGTMHKTFRTSQLCYTTVLQPLYRSTLPSVL